MGDKGSFFEMSKNWKRGKRVEESRGSKRDIRDENVFGQFRVGIQGGWGRGFGGGEVRGSETIRFGGKILNFRQRSLLDI